MTTQTTTFAQATGDALAGRLTSPAHTDSPDRTEPWWRQSLDQGAAGIAMLHIERARSGRGGWDVAHDWLSFAAGGDISGAPNGLFYGAPAVAFAVSAAADTPRTGERALAALDARITAMTRRRLDTARARIARGELPTPTEYDLIGGLTGLGVYLLRRPAHRDLLAEVLSYLVALTEPVSWAGSTVPGWWTDRDPTGHRAEAFIAGHGNFGMAHGITGCLAFLATTARHGVVVDGHTDAITTICGWLDHWRQDAATGPWWPEWITYDELADDQPHTPGPPRPSWCYGTPGIARAQQLAGIATGDTRRQDLAEQAMTRCLADPAQLSRVTDATLCHGTAGVYQTVWRMAADARTPAIAAHLPARLEAIIGDGTRDPQAVAASIHAGLPGETGLLSGATGVALALHTAATGAAPVSGWDACLLLG